MPKTLWSSSTRCPGLHSHMDDGSGFESQWSALVVGADGRIRLWRSDAAVRLWNEEGYELRLWRSDAHQGTSLELEVRKLLPCESPTIASARSPCWSCLQPLSLLHTTVEGGKIAVAATNHEHASMPPPATIAVEVGNGRGGLPRCSLLTAKRVGEADGSHSSRDGREKNAWERRRRPPLCSALRRRHPP
nr:hypothetical protein Iba_chr07eCG6390 [Ipomoea batatas]